MLVLAACLIAQQLATGLASHKTVVQSANVHVSTCDCNGTSLWLPCSVLLEALCTTTTRKIVANCLLSHWHVLAIGANNQPN